MCLHYLGKFEVSDTVFVRCVSVCLCAADRSMRPMNNIIELPNSTDSRFSNHVCRDSPDMTAVTLPLKIHLAEICSVKSAF